MRSCPVLPARACSDVEGDTVGSARRMRTSRSRADDGSVEDVHRLLTAVPIFMGKGKPSVPLDDGDVRVVIQSDDLAPSQV